MRSVIQMKKYLDRMFCGDKKNIRENVIRTCKRQFYIKVNNVPKDINWLKSKKMQIQLVNG